jgi:hypothetical protein
MIRIEYNTFKYLLDHTDKTLVIIDVISGKKFRLIGAGTSSNSNQVTMRIEEEK